jgi:hypothetical protein
MTKVGASVSSYANGEKTYNPAEYHGKFLAPARTVSHPLI